MNEFTLLIWLVGAFLIWRQQVRLGRLERQVAALKPDLASDPAAPVAVVGDAAADPAGAASGGAASGGEPARRRSSLEQRLTQHWFVWLGGIVLALGALLLVRAAAESGLLGPSVRLALAALGGLAAIVGAEFLVARTATDRLNPLVPASLAAAGVAALYAAVWAAYQLYGQISATLAFVGLAGIAFLAIVLALRPGAFLAWLGVGGGLAVPALAGGDSGNLAVLSGYLAAVFGGAFATLRQRPWHAFAWALVVAVTVWPAIILLFASLGASPAGTNEARPLGWLLAALAILALALPQAGVGGRSWPAGLQAALALIWLSWIVTFGAAVALWPLAIAIGLAIAVARTRQWQRAAVVMLPLAGLSALLAIDLGGLDWQAFGTLTTEPDRWNVAHAMLRPARLAEFQALATVIGGVTALAALAAIRGARWPGFWAAVAIGAPLLVLAAGYLRLGAIPDLARLLAFLALAVALAGALLAGWLKRRRPVLVGAVGAFVLGAIGGLALAAVMIVERGWLPLALAVMALATLQLWQRLRLRALLVAAPWPAWAAAFLALAVPEASGLWQSGPSVDLTAALLGAGIPAVLVWSAARPIPRRAAAVADRLRLAGLLLAMLFVGRIAAWVAAGSPLVEAGLQASYWLLVIAWAVHGARQRRWFLIVTIAAHAALILLIALPVLIEDGNPLRVAQPVGDWPIVNQLLPGYGLPALAAIALTAALAAAGWRRAALAAGGLGLALALFYAALEIRRAFGGPVLTGPTLQGELYAYSLLLLITAAGLLAAGLIRDLSALRWAGVALLATAVGKLFLVDLAHLDGVLRAAAFLGLGAALIAVGYASRRWQSALS